MNASVVEAATALIPQGAKAGDALLDSLLALGNALVDGFRTRDVIPRYG